MKLSVSLSDEDVEFVDTYAQNQGIESRSAVLQRAVQLLRALELGPAYEAAWMEWDSADDATAWDRVAADGLQ